MTENALISKEKLIESALVARNHAYAPYSKFAVGAAVLTPEGEIFTGCNVENAASPEGICAEATAISSMIVGGSRRIEAIAVVGGDANRICMPCGGCRQKIQEFGTAKTRVYVADAEGTLLRELTLADILPEPFGP